MYDKNNVFAKIIRGEIPSRVVYSDDYVLAFHDNAPRAKTHVLVVPRGEYTDIYDFTANAPTELQMGFWRGVRATVDALGLRENFRTVANTGPGPGKACSIFMCI